MTRILAIDDDQAITSVIARALQRDGYEVVTKNHALEVLSCDLSYFDLILCDVMMPELDGFELVRMIRDTTDAPIVLVTAKAAEQDAVMGLSLGADDYIRKPFGVSELRAKVAAHLRRENREHTQVLSLGNVRLNLKAQELTVSDQAISLTPTEYQICEYLARHHGQVFSRAQIRDSVLGWTSEVSEDTISMHVSNARNKLKQAGSDAITTVWGVGYKWRV